MQDLKGALFLVAEVDGMDDVQCVAGVFIGGRGFVTERYRLSVSMPFLRTENPPQRFI